MTDRIYRTLLGLAILLALYFESAVVIYALIIMLLAEGITGFTVPRAVGTLGGSMGVPAWAYRTGPCNPQPRFNFDGERVWRLLVAVIMLLTYSFYEYLWFIPWFMGFTIFGAGLSGVCPVLMAVRWVGFE